MSKHIPGPWKVEIIRGSKLAVTAGMRPIVTFDDDDPKKEANAQFIASAPTRLTAADTLVVAFKRLINTIEREGFIADGDFQVEEAKAALCQFEEAT